MISESDVAWFIDYDRTLGDVDKDTEDLALVLNISGIGDSVKLEVNRTKVERSGQSFDPIKHLIEDQNLSQGDIELLTDKFADQARPYRLHADGIRLLQRLGDPNRNPNRNVFIFTQGNMLYQLAKLKSRGLEDYPRIITDRNNKSEFIANAKNPETQRYEILTDNLGILVARTVVGVDDKIKCINQMPLDCTGIHVERLPANTVIPTNKLAPNIGRFPNLDYIDVDDTYPKKFR